ncbi:SCO6745 family protein [Yinghuangia seranimata]|uniref:SCO6745 family protein n=1 Tax=Yinghuangia seranimata TaxID=408067 RepID=UPI00248C310A|nr:hypothetical protein [Yinghuangia seranimata]MDI2132312.1 hypothetical protein [Yinghuangia seranimata]
MTTTVTPELARRLWRAIEPIHGVAYYAPESIEATRGLGLIGYWMGYFAGRLAPVGAVDARTASALSFAFAPRRVERAIPEAWAIAAPDKVVQARLDAVSTTLKGAGAERKAIARLADLFELAVEGCAFEGRALAAGWADVPRPADPEARLWLATAVLREHRGDGHVIAVTYHGLSGLEAGVTHVATGEVSRELIQTTRAWTDEEWEQAVERLTTRGLIAEGGGLTDKGRNLRREIEDTTDRLASSQADTLGTEGVEEALTLAVSIGRRISERGLFLVPNPIGVPHP